MLLDAELLKRPPMNGSDDIDDFNVVVCLLLANFGVILGRVKLENVWKMREIILD